MVMQPVSVGGSGGGADYTAIQVIGKYLGVYMTYTDACGTLQGNKYITYSSGRIECQENSAIIESYKYSPDISPGQTSFATMYVKDGTLYIEGKVV